MYVAPTLRGSLPPRGLTRLGAARRRVIGALQNLRLLAMSACSRAWPSAQSPRPVSALMWPACATVHKFGAPGGGKLLRARQAAIGVVLGCPTTRAANGSALQHHGRPALEHGAQLLALRVARCHQEGGLYLVRVVRMLRPTLRSSMHPRLCATSTTGVGAANTASSSCAIQSPRSGRIQSCCCTRV